MVLETGAEPARLVVRQWPHPHAALERTACSSEPCTLWSVSERTVALAVPPVARHDSPQCSASACGAAPPLPREQYPLFRVGTGRITSTRSTAIVLPEPNASPRTAHRGRSRTASRCLCCRPSPTSRHRAAPAVHSVSRSSLAVPRSAANSSQPQRSQCRRIPFLPSHAG